MPEDEQDPNECPETEDGEHVIDDYSLVDIGDIEPGVNATIDVTCTACGRSGSFMVSVEDIQW